MVLLCDDEGRVGNVEAVKCDSDGQAKGVGFTPKQAIQFALVGQEDLLLQNPIKASRGIDMTVKWE